MFLEMLNAVTSLFTPLDSYFARGFPEIGLDSVADLAAGVISELGVDARLAGAGLTSSLSDKEVIGEIEKQIARLHSEPLNPDDYERLQAVQDVVTYNFMKSYLPRYVREDLKKMPAFVDHAIKKQLGPKFGRNELVRLAGALIELSKTYSNILIAPEEEVVMKYGPMVLTPHRLFEATLERLYVFPPFIIQRARNEFACIVPEQPFLGMRKAELEFIRQMRGRHPNVSGDSVETIISKFLTERQLVRDDEPPSGFASIKKHHPHHFTSARKVRRSRHTREDIFAVLDNPDQPELEIDLVANHPDRFSVLGETKFVTSYSNAEAYYYQGSDEKQPEKTRLLRLTEYLNTHPRRKREFGIPEANPIVPAFITNGVGPLFADDDGVIKSTPFEVMRVEPFYKLVRAGI
jgi:hypothetical protein